MSIGLSTALSGISVANERLRAAASNLGNLANGATGDDRRLLVEAQTLEPGGVRAQLRQATAAGRSAEAELTTQRSATYAFVANLRALQTQVQASGSLLDVHA